MSERLQAQVSRQVQELIAPAGRYLATLMRSSPAESADWLLARPDVNAIISEVLAEARDAAGSLVAQAWYEAGGGEGLIDHLLSDIHRIFSDTPRLHKLIRAAYPKGPEDVEEAVSRFARQAALRARLAVSHAAGSGRTAAVLEEARARQEDGELLEKRWRRNPQSDSCYWCRKLDGVTIPLDADFGPHLGGPVEFPHQRERHVASPAGERRFGQQLGAPIVLTRPPNPYHGELPGPLLHPHCECSLEVLPAGTRIEGSPPEHSPPAPAGFLSSADIREMPEAKYRSLLAFLEAAVHELRQVLQRLARRG